MSPAYLSSSHDPLVVLLSFLVASCASFVALHLAQRVRTPDRLQALGWWAGGSLVMGTGIWSMHFVGMLAYQLPIEVGYDAGYTALSWLAAVAVSMWALGLSARPACGWRGCLAGATVMGLGIAAMHYIGMAALVLSPGVDWQPAWVLASVAVGIAASAAALKLFRRQEATSPQLTRPLLLRLGAALLMAAAISGMHYTGMAAVRVPQGAVCLSAQGLHSDGLEVLVAGATLLLLLLGLFSSLLDQRLRERTERLSDSLRATNEELERAMLHDALTDLPNRLLLEERLRQLAQQCDRRGGHLALVYIDLDGFKPLNDLYGHTFGDLALREVAQRLRRHLRSDDLSARLGGDEFVMLLTDVPQADAAVAAAQRVIAALRQPMRLDQREVQLDASAGLALYPEHGPVERLLGAADAAMYAAKRLGRGQVVVFQPQMEAQARDELELAQALRQALAQGSGLSLHYQPKVNADDGRVCGLEALLRWQHPQRGMVSPTQFIAVAERNGLIGELGLWVIDEACRQMRAWQQQGLTLSVAVNLSMHQLRDPTLATQVQRLLQRHSLPAQRLMLEITESAAMQDIDVTLKVMDALAALGTVLSIDDFGTGYSSLSYLRRLPVGQLKVDRSFVKDLGPCDDARAIVGAVVGLAHALGLTVVAEGVETAAQRDTLRQLGCDQLQGYLLARPVPAALIMRWALGMDRPAALWFDDAAMVEPALRPALLAALP